MLIVVLEIQSCGRKIKKHFYQYTQLNYKFIDFHPAIQCSVSAATSVQPRARDNQKFSDCYCHLHCKFAKSKTPRFRENKTFSAILSAHVAGSYIPSPPQALADCACIIFGIIGAKKHNFLNEHCYGIISKF